MVLQVDSDGKMSNYQMICHILLKPEWTMRVMLCRGSIMYFLVCFNDSYHDKNTDILSFAVLSQEYAKRYRNAGTSPEIM